MTYREWLWYAMDPTELILNASAIDGSDFHQHHPIGVSVFLVEALPRDPAELSLVPQHDWTSYVANAIFRVDTTRLKEQLRRRAQQQLLNKDFVFQDMRQGDSRLSAAETLQWYLRTPFTISPRGHGIDCHRNYEALICKSVPIILGGDETLREKYSQLPVKFVDTYAELTKTKLREWYRELLGQQFNFNHLCRSYWEARRPDVNIRHQSVHWLKRFGKLAHATHYLQGVARPKI